MNKIKRLGLIARIIFFIGMGFLLIINAQPWMELAARIVPTINRIPFLDSLIQIPFLGGWIQLLVHELTSVLGALLCVTVQLIEIFPIVIDNPSPAFKKRLNTYRWICYAIEFSVCFLRFPPYEGGTSAFFEDFLNWDWYLLDWWNLIFLIVTMTGFEICFATALAILQGIEKPERA